MKVDLHLHTDCSDGELSPEEAVREANKKGLEIISITDHDTIAGVSRAMEEGRRLGVRVIPGVEITVRFNRDYFTGSLHVLCYFSTELFDDGAFRHDLESTVSKGRGLSLVSSRVRRINSEFGPQGRDPLLSRELEVEEITSLADNVSRRHFAIALSKNHGLSREEVSRLIGNDSPAYVPSGIDIRDLADFIGKYSMVPVLAHPAAGSFPGESHYKEVLPPLDVVERILPEFLEIGVLGLEAYYPGHTPEHVEYLLELAGNMGLVVTGGSDSHDSVQRPIQEAGFVGDVSGFLSLLQLRS